jgi:TonB-linked SusC/RagA family outer membrane protein
MRKIIYLLAFVLCLGALESRAQQTREVKGLVLGKSDEMPLISATVYVSKQDLQRINYESPTLGTITDLDGRFRFDVPQGVDTLYVTYMGYEEEKVNIKGKNFVTVHLVERSTDLEEVVITGYQNIEKHKLTASVGKMEMEENMKPAVMSVDQMIQGQLAGVTTMATSGAPGAPVKIRIRGTASINGTQDPLWVLDGMPLEGTEVPDLEDTDVSQLYNSSIGGLNPSDIKSITVLKDAAATAIYGARAANGVIVITTKSGKKGDMRVNFSGRTSVATKPDISNLNLMNASEKVDLELSLLQSDYSYRESKGGVARILDTYGERSLFANQGWDAVSQEAKDEITNLRKINTDWNDMLFRSSINHDYSLSLSGGSESLKYYGSVGYYNEQGITEGTGMERFNLTTKTTFTPTDKFTFNVGVYANQRRNRSFLTGTGGHTNPVYYSRRANPYQQVRDEEGFYLYDTDIQGQSEYVVPFNILEERSNTDYELLSRSLNGIFDMEYELLPSLSFTSQLGLQVDYSQTMKYADNETYYTRRQIAQSKVTVDADGDGQKDDAVYLIPEGGVYNDFSSRSFQYTWKNMIRFDKRFQDHHEVEVMIGNEVRRNNYSSINSIAYGYDKQSLTDLSLLFYEQDIADRYDLFRRGEVENAFISVFSTFSYSYMRKYTIGGSIRFDGSDLFGVDPKYKYLPLYSLSASWNAHKETFVKDVDWISTLTLRASYGLQGNIDKNTSPQLMGTLKRFQLLPGHENEFMIDVTAPPNDKLRWEKTQSYNVGMNLGFLENRINLSFDHYQRHSSDLIGQQSIPLSVGFSTISVNWAKMNNKGYELNLSTVNVKGDEFQWSTDFNIAYNKNEVERIQVAENTTYPTAEGYSVDALFALDYVGLDEQGYPLFLNPEGQKVTLTQLIGFKEGLGGTGTKGISAAEERALYSFMGTQTPKYSGGFNNHFNYKNVRLDVFLAFNLGHVARVKPPYSLTRYDRGMNNNAIILDRWTPGNPTDNPALIDQAGADAAHAYDYYGYDSFNYDRYFDDYVKDAGYIRLQSIRLSYDFNDEWLKKLHLGSASLSLEARNLYVFAMGDYDGYMDPETLGNLYAQPIPKTFTLGLNIGF